ncbi:MAG: metallophosphoesterase family protein [Phycisphaeraceae bacterium]|nr:metallophosphoesterase family protein [Phycisphaeraceae bacterium]
MKLAAPCSFVRLARLGTLFLAAIAPPSAFAGHGHPPVRVGPFLQDAEPTSVWVVWETEGEARSEVRHGPTPKLGRVARGDSIPGQDGSRIHHVMLEGLDPDASHYYAIDAEGDRGGTFRFRTPPNRDAGHAFRFVVYSDTQSGPDSRKHAEVIDEGVIRFVTTEFGPEISDELAFTLIPGDLVDSGSKYHQWKDQFFDEEQNLARHVPIYPVPGNHEQDAHWFFDYFHLPENGTPGFEEHWWYKDHGNVRVIGLDSNEGYRTAAQLDWLDEVLAEAAEDSIIDFVFAQLHHPHKTPAWTPGDTDWTGEVVRRLERFSTETGKPSIHFFGHTHAYERGQSRDHHHLWVDVSATEGDLAWWGEYPATDHPEFQKVLMDWGFVLMEVEDGENPSFRMRRVSRGNQFDPKDNEIVDDITIRHRNPAPARPTAIEPQTGVGGFPADDGVLRGSEFRDPNGDRHLASHFQLTTTAGDYASPVRDEWIRFENWFAPPDATGRADGYYSVDTRAGKDVRELDLGMLDPHTTYFWRVRYRDSGLTWSEWSEEASFTTGAAALGAACLPEGGCRMMRRAEAEAMGARWSGVGTSCDDAGCPEFVTLFEESFDDLVLRAPSMEPGDEPAWTPTPPTGWTTNREEMTGGGVDEWRGWAFARPAFWVRVAGDQGRAGFALGDGVIAIADSDEWHDAETEHPGGGEGGFLARMTTPAISLEGVRPGSLRLAFDSAWMPDEPMAARVLARFEPGETVEVFQWRSESDGENYKSSSINERVRVSIEVPRNARSVRFVFELGEANNDWFWAIDDIRVYAAPDRPLDESGN